MPSQAETGPPAADGPAGQDPRWRHEPAVRAALREHWGLQDGLRPMQANPASLTWQANGHVIKFARDEPGHFTAGLLASEAVERAGIASSTGPKLRSGMPPGMSPSADQKPY